MMMDEYFVRVYHMKDGSVSAPNSIYADEMQAKRALNHFNPRGNAGIAPEQDMDLVSYMTVEKRYAPKGRIWSEEERVAQQRASIGGLLQYLDRLISLKGNGQFVNGEITEVLETINRELGLEPKIGQNDTFRPRLP